MLYQLFVGILAGTVYGLLGYFKSEEKFDVIKFSRVLVIGAVVGGYAGWKGIDWNSSYTFLASAGVVALIDFLVKGVWKKLKK